MGFMKRFTPHLILLFLTAIGSAVADNQTQPDTSSIQNEIVASPPIYIRLFKEERTLEIWQQGRTGHYLLHSTYPICRYSGLTGPKLHEGDLQSPEGFYSLTSDSMHPDSRFHLALDISFPNEYDKAHGRTGSALMIHGDCVSRGCYAMTDSYIEEIYAIVDHAFNGGQSEIPVHIFPFRMHEMNMDYYRHSKWIDFWQQLRKGYLLLEQNRYPPLVEVVNGQYIISSGMARQLITHAMPTAENR